MTPVKSIVQKKRKLLCQTIQKLFTVVCLDKGSSFAISSLFFAIPLYSINYANAIKIFNPFKITFESLKAMFLFSTVVSKFHAVNWAIAMIHIWLEPLNLLINLLCHSLPTFSLFHVTVSTCNMAPFKALSFVITFWCIIIIIIVREEGIFFYLCVNTELWRHVVSTYISLFLPLFYKQV